MMRRIIFIALILSTIISCKSVEKTIQESIDYKFIPSVEEMIDSTILNLEQSYINSDETESIFVLMGYFGFNTSMIFNYYENMPSQIQHQIDISNRFIVTKNRKIPVIFHLDDGNTLVRTDGVNHGVIGGYSLEIDVEGNKLLNGIVH